MCSSSPQSFVLRSLMIMKCLERTTWNLEVFAVVAVGNLPLVSPIFVMTWISSR